MFEPPIHWHYAGKLRHSLLDQASRAYADQLIRALKDGNGPTILLSPVPLEHRLSETIKRLFEAAGVSVYALTEGLGCRYGLSTTYDEDAAGLRLATMSMDLEAEIAAAGAGAMPGVDPPAVRKRNSWSLRRLLVRMQDSIRPSKLAELKHHCRAARAEVILVEPLPRPSYASDDPTHATRLARSLGRLCALDPAFRTLPVPSLDRDTLLGLVASLPAQILDGSSRHEREVEGALAKAAAETPEGFLAQTLWRALKKGYGPDRLSSSEFESRYERLDPDIARASPWSALFDLWRSVLRGLDSDREYAGRWLDKIRARPAGPVSFEDIDDILLHEAALYGIYCEGDRSALPYLIVYHGTRWLQGRMALGALFGGGGDAGSPFDGLSWDR